MSNDSEKVVPFKIVPKGDPRVNPELVKTLKALTERAEKGEVYGALILYEDAENVYHARVGYTCRYYAMGLLSRFIGRLNREFEQ